MIPRLNSIKLSIYILTEAKFFDTSGKERSHRQVHDFMNFNSFNSKLHYVQYWSNKAPKNLIHSRN